MNTTTILCKELNEAVYQCRRDLAKAQEALRQLHKLSDYPTPSTLSDITRSNLIAFCDQRVNAVKATPLYTAKERERIINDWIEWRIKAMPHVLTIENFVNDWQAVSPVLDTATMTILTSDIAEDLTPLYTVAVPLQAHTHLQLINSVRAALNSLREWEREQDTKKIPIAKLLQRSEQDIILSWINGGIKVDHSQDDEGAKVWREAFNANII